MRQLKLHFKGDSFFIYPILYFIMMIILFQFANSGTIEVIYISITLVLLMTVPERLNQDYHNTYFEFLSTMGYSKECILLYYYIADCIIYGLHGALFFIISILIFDITQYYTIFTILLLIFSSIAIIACTTVINLGGEGFVLHALLTFPLLVTNLIFAILSQEDSQYIWIMCVISIVTIPLFIMSASYMLDIAIEDH